MPTKRKKRPPARRTPSRAQKRKRGPRVAPKAARPSSSIPSSGARALALGLFLGSVLYVGWNGGYVGAAIVDGLDALIGGASWGARGLVAVGGLMVARSALVDVRPFRTGSSSSCFGLMVALGRDQGGYLGQVLGGAVGRDRRTGSTILGVLALLVGGLLLSGASLGAILRRSGTRCARTLRARRPARTVAHAQRLVAAARCVAARRARRRRRGGRLSRRRRRRPVDLSRSRRRRSCSSPSRSHEQRRSSTTRRRAREYKLPDRRSCASRPSRADRSPGETARVADVLVADARALRRRRERDRPDLRPARHALRAAARARHEGRRRSPR